MIQTRRYERPRSSRDHHSNPTDVLYRFSTSMEPRSMGPPHPSGTPHRHPWAPLGTPWHPWAPLGTPGHSIKKFALECLRTSIMGPRMTAETGFDPPHFQTEAWLCERLRVPLQSQKIRQAFRPQACEILTDVLQVLVPRLFVPPNVRSNFSYSLPRTPDPRCREIESSRRP